MKEQLELIARANSKPGCNYSSSPLADTWFVNLGITKSKALPFVIVTNARDRPVSVLNSANGDWRRKI